jgi:pSer/pThr/pTyr-binding forkhead associated (FHA) protein
MAKPGKAPDGRQIWKAVRDELMLNLYPLPYSTLAPTVYHVYLHPGDFEAIEDVCPRITAQIERALTGEVEAMNRKAERSARRVLTRLLEQEPLAPIEVPAAGWKVYIQADRNGELERGFLGIVSTLSVPAPAEYGGTPTTRIIRSVVGGSQRNATTELRQASSAAAAPAPQDSGERARLTYQDDQGTHTFSMRKDSLSVGRGGSSAWVDVQVIAASKVSREHFRVRRDAAGRFFIQDVSLWGTTVNGEALPPAVKTVDGVARPGPERELPPSARIGLADVLVIQFEAAPHGQRPTTNE